MDHAPAAKTSPQIESTGAPSDDRIVGALRVIEPANGAGLGSRIETLVERALAKHRDKVDSFVKVNATNYLLYLTNPSEDEAQFEANLLSEELREELTARLKLGPDLRLKTIVLKMPVLTLAGAVGFPDRLLDLIARTWDQKKSREKEEAAAFGENSRPAGRRSARGGAETITYVDDDIDNALSRLSPQDIDRLPFGVIKITRTGTVLQFNTKEAELTKLVPQDIIGRNFFRDIAPCTNRREFLGRFADGVKSGKLDVTFNYLFDFRMRPRRVKVHLKKSYHDDHYWILVEMDEHSSAK
ncbi:MAG TPA: PAS domain-containing protein [Alphaproteobacteria bacterium]